MREFSLEEVRRHRQKNDVWVVYQGKVVDISPFAEKHPGGLDILLNSAGEDVTEVMRSAPHEHTQYAYNILNKYVIGRLEGYPNNNKIDQNSTHSVEDEHDFYDWSEDKLVDWSKPIFWQVGQLGDKYMDWCHQPIDKEIRLFYSDFCEFFSKTQWWVIPIVWLPIIAGLTKLGYQAFADDSFEFFSKFGVTGFPMTWMSMLPLFCSGVLLWSFLEYAVHRWLFHMTPPENSPFLITAHFVLHGQHHKSPFDRLRLVFPPVPAFGFVAIFYITYTVLLPYPIAMTLLGGTAAGYMLYDLTHYYLHHGGQPLLNYFQNLKQYHNAHHFEHQSKGFGISSKLWDFPFQTLIPKKTTKTS